MHGEARGHRVDAHIVLGALDGGTPGERHDSCFGRGVMGLALLGPPAENRSVVDDHTTAVGIEVLQLGPHATERAVERDIEHQIPLIIGHVDDRDLAAETGVVDDDVEAAQRFGRARNEGLHIGLNSDITRDSHHTKFGGRLGTPTLMLIGDDYRGPLLDAALGHREPDPGSGGGSDEHLLTGE